MPIVTANDLADAVRDLGLFGAGRQAELRELAADTPSLRDLARQMLQRRWLTAFQANQLLRGNGRRLILGPYLLLERIGTGGMGEVFKAFHRRLHRLAAVKVLNRDRLEHPSAMARFLREVESAAHLSHPNIVAVHDAGHDADTHFLAMEFIDGLDLSRLVGKVGPLPYSLACDFLSQAALGLHHAHEQGFVHRDIKPPNLLAAPRGGLSKLGGDLTPERFQGATVKVLDMGLVRQKPEHLDATHLALTQQGVVIGTMDYLAPEQARNSHRVDRRADLYSLGCTLYHLLTGEPPFKGETPIDKLLKHQTDDPPRVSRVRADVPDELDAVVRRLMAKRPENRYADAAEAAQALGAFAAEPLSPALMLGPMVEMEAVPNLGTTCHYDTPVARQEEATPLIVAPSPPSRRVSRKIRRVRRRSQTRWRWVAAGAALAVMLALFAAGFLKSGPAPETKKGEPVGSPSLSR